MVPEIQPDSVSSHKNCEKRSGTILTCYVYLIFGVNNDLQLATCLDRERGGCGSRKASMFTHLLPPNRRSHSPHL